MSKKKQNIEINTRKSAMVLMSDAWHKENDFIEVTEWSNKEGWDIQINQQQTFSLHFTEYDVLKKLIKKLEQ